MLCTLYKTLPCPSKNDINAHQLSISNPLYAKPTNTHLHLSNPFFSSRSKHRIILRTPPRVTALTPLTRITTSGRRVQASPCSQSMDGTRRSPRLWSGIGRMFDGLAAVCFV
jgi:hypothetical protein